MVAINGCVTVINREAAVHASMEQNIQQKANQQTLTQTHTYGAMQLMAAQLAEGRWGRCHRDFAPLARDWDDSSLHNKAD